MNLLNQNKRNILVPLLCVLAAIALMIFQSVSVHARGGMGGGGGMGMRGGEHSMIPSPEEQAMEIAEKLSLSKGQRGEVVYLLEKMFKQQSAYLKQAQDSDESSRTEAMGKIKKIRNNTIDLVGDFLSDDQLAQLTELLNADMKRPSEGRSTEGFAGGGRSSHS